MISVGILNYPYPIVANDKQKQGKAPVRTDAQPVVNQPATAKPIQITFSNGWAITIIVTLLTVISIIGYGFFEYVWKDLSGKITVVHGSLDTIKGTLQDQRITIATLEKGLSSIEQRMLNLDRPRLESKAKAAGFKNPQIVAAGLSGNERIGPRIVLKDGENFIQYTILTYDRSTQEITMSFDARIGRMQFDNNYLRMKAEPGQIQEVMFIRGKGIPRIFVQVLELPSPDSAILAIGPKTDPADKTS